MKRLIYFIVLFGYCQLSFGQASLGVIGSDTTTKPIVGVFRPSIKDNKLYIVRNSGNALRIALYSELTNANFLPVNNPTNTGLFTSPSLLITGTAEINKGSNLFMSANANDFGINNGNGGKVILGTAGFQRLIITNAGYVGIGTIAPTTKLNVAGIGSLRLQLGSEGVGKILSSDATGIASWVDLNTAIGYTTANDANVIHTTLDESASGIKSFTTSINSPKYTITGTGYVANGNDVAFGAGNASDVVTYNPTGRILYSTNGFVRMAITNAGYVGIGTIAPTAKFEVSGLGAFKYNNGTAAIGRILQSDATGIATWVDKCFSYNFTDVNLIVIPGITHGKSQVLNVTAFDSFGYKLEPMVWVNPTTQDVEVTFNTLQSGRLHIF